MFYLDLNCQLVLWSGKVNSEQFFQSLPSHLLILTTRLLDSADPVGCCHVSHESGTAGNIIALPAVPPP
jgi:hypothetical protein